MKGDKDMQNNSSCPNCGGRITPGSAFCSNCGAALPRQNTSNQYFQQPYRPETPTPTVTPDLPMKWHNALTTWLMIVWGIVNIAVAVSYFTGMAYFFGENLSGRALERAVDYLYDLAPMLQTVAIGAGIYSAVFGIACFFVFPKLKRFEAEGLRYFNLLMKSSFIANILIPIGIYIALSDVPFVDPADSINFASILFPLAFASANITYYKKREHLFK